MGLFDSDDVMDIGVIYDINEELRKENDQLKAENEELKKQVDDLLHKPEIQDKIFWKIDNEKVLLGQETYIYKLKQTLTEIKEIAEKCCIMQAILDCENYDDCTQCGRISDSEGIQQILQKISECEVEDE